MYKFLVSEYVYNKFAREMPELLYLLQPSGYIPDDRYYKFDSELKWECGLTDEMIKEFIDNYGR